MTANKEKHSLKASKPNISENAMVRRISLSSIIGNVVLSAFKLYAGIFGNSGAMISDAVHSLSDIITTFIAALGVKIAKKAPDKEHPYGHERLESIASLLLGAVLMVTGIMIGKEGITKIFTAGQEEIAIPGAIALVAAFVSIAVKEAMYWYTRHYAKLMDSPAFMADAWHHRSDALSSVGSLVGIGGAMLGFPVLDAVASVVICLFIVKVAYDIMKDGLKKITDTSCGEAYDKELADFIARQDDVLRVNSLRSRLFGNKIYVDLEIQMDGRKTLNETHEAAELIHDKVEKAFPGIKHIMIHVNPTPGESRP